MVVAVPVVALQPHGPKDEADGEPSAELPDHGVIRAHTCPPFFNQAFRSISDILPSENSSKILCLSDQRPGFLG